MDNLGFVEVDISVFLPQRLQFLKRNFVYYNQGHKIKFYMSEKQAQAENLHAHWSHLDPNHLVFVVKNV